MLRRGDLIAVAVIIALVVAGLYFGWIRTSIGY